MVWVAARDISHKMFFGLGACLLINDTQTLNFLIHVVKLTFSKNRCAGNQGCPNGNMVVVVFVRHLNKSLAISEAVWVYLPFSLLEMGHIENTELFGWEIKSSKPKKWEFSFIRIYYTLWWASTQSYHIIKPCSHAWKKVGFLLIFSSSIQQHRYTSVKFINLAVFPIKW